MIFVAASSRSASSSTMHESLPPSSICSGIIPAFFDMEIPVSQPPVKLHQTSHIWYLDAFFLIGIVLPKSEIEIEILKLSDSGGFQSPDNRYEEKIVLNCQISILGFQCVAQNIEDDFKKITS